MKEKTRKKLEEMLEELQSEDKQDLFNKNMWLFLLIATPLLFNDEEKSTINIYLGSDKNV